MFCSKNGCYRFSRFPSLLLCYTLKEGGVWPWGREGPVPQGLDIPVMVVSWYLTISTGGNFFHLCPEIE